MRATLGIVTLIFGMMFSCGEPPQNLARDTAAALGGAITTAQTQYQTSCTANKTQQVCQVIDKAVAAQNALITADETYCGWPVGTGTNSNNPCVPVANATAALQAAIVNANAFITQLKAVL